MVLDSLRVAFVLPYPVVLDSLEVILYPVTVIPAPIVGNFGAPPTRCDVHSVPSGGRPRGAGDRSRSCDAPELSSQGRGL